MRCCVIHYAVHGDMVIPFCVYNGGRAFRDEVEKKFSISLKE